VLVVPGITDTLCKLQPVVHTWATDWQTPKEQALSWNVVDTVRKAAVAGEMPTAVAVTIN
jgi:hypothetical protein